MKTKNILKIGVFSIVVFALLVSPVLLNLHPQKASADGPIGPIIPSIEQAAGASWEEIIARIPESLAAKWCDEIYGEKEWQAPLSKNWWSHKFCVLQLSVIEGIGATISALTQSLISYIVWALNPVTYGGFVNNIAVRGIWSVLRNFMNLTLALILVFIAIATILGIKKYRWQETLWKLLIVALLINFSLIIPGIILDTSHFITFTFLNLAKVDDLNIANSIMKALSMEEFARADKYKLSMTDDIKASYDSATKETTADATGWGLGMGKSMITTAFLLLIGLFVIIALTAIFFTMIFRAFIIIALLCVAPIAFASWILPNTAGLWKTWWNHFLKWCAFIIIFALMLYMGIYIMNGIELGTAGLVEKNIKIGLIATVVRMVLFSMFLVGGLIFSIQEGGVVSKTVMQQSSKIGAAAGAFLGHKALKGAASSETWRKAQKRLEDSKFAPTHDIGVWMGRQPGKIRAAELKQIEEDYKNQSDDQIRHDREVHKNDKARVAVATNTLIERNKIDYAKDSESIKIARNQSNLNVPGLKKVHPELYVEYFTKPEDMEKAILQAQSTAPYIISRDEAKKRASIDLVTKRIKESGPEAIKSGNWDNILERLEAKGVSENKGKQYIDHFFRSLWDSKVPPEGFAAMLRLMDTEKQAKWTQEYVDSIGRRENKPQANILKELSKRKYYKNRFLLELLPPEPKP